MTTITEKIEAGIVEHAYDKLMDIYNDMQKDDTFDIDDLHHKLFNEDYFVIGYYNASEWMKKNNIDAFDLIDYVQTYEREHFGQVSTEINSESMVNMYAYIRGAELLNELDLDWNIVSRSKMQMFDILHDLKFRLT